METSFVLTTRLDSPPQTVWDHLAEPRNYLGLQVLLTWMSAVTEGRSAAGLPTRRYRTVETFRWLGLPVYRNSIDVELELTEPGRQLVSRVAGALGLRLTADYRFEPHGEGCLLSLSVQVEVGRWLSGPVTREARRVQNLVLERLRDRLRSTPSGPATPTTLRR